MAIALDLETVSASPGCIFVVYVNVYDLSQSGGVGGMSGDNKKQAASGSGSFFSYDGTADYEGLVYSGDFHLLPEE